MPGGSIYVQPDEKFTGASPQWLYEKHWHEDAKSRLRLRAVKAAVAFAIGFGLAVRFDLFGPLSYATGAALLAAAADWWWAWRSFQSTAVWRGRRRGEVIMGRQLRRSLSRRGYRILDGRAIRGQASIDHLVIGPNGVWLVDNEAWSPDTEIAAYGGRLFFGEKYGTRVAKPLVEAGAAFAELLSRETGIPVTITPILAVHGGLLPHGGVLAAEGITLIKPGRVARLIRETGTQALSEAQIELLARTAARELDRAA
ncbi:nuclease-related domain-containing protein [Thermoactinospora rubra]|uniref:nuclease-related domain-containing protein n=1 Tax=Thermoactinospora rubra TaxID=1088767 RepID=UPI000A102229|nr:nuclease-related domain-containing protein [Thermoactinospora rubra]